MSIPYLIGGRQRRYFLLSAVFHPIFLLCIWQGTVGHNTYFLLYTSSDPDIFSSYNNSLGTL